MFLFLFCPSGTSSQFLWLTPHAYTGELTAASNLGKASGRRPLDLSLWCGSTCSKLRGMFRGQHCPASVWYQDSQCILSWFLFGIQEDKQCISLSNPRKECQVASGLQPRPLVCVDLFSCLGTVWGWAAALSADKAVAQVGPNQARL